MLLFVAAITKWNNCYWGGGGGGGGGGQQTCLQSQLWGIFIFAGNSWKYVELPEIWILSQS